MSLRACPNGLQSEKPLPRIKNADTSRPYFLFRLAFFYYLLKDILFMFHPTSRELSMMRLSECRMEQVPIMLSVSISGKANDAVWLFKFCHKMQDFYLFVSQKSCIFAVVIIAMMDYDISQPVPQGSDGAQDAENSRIAAIADELDRLCAVYETQLGDSQPDVSRFETN